ncbi:PTS lactose/cellobiose transporter subunit IIA [Caldibacillus debilis]|jgi:PTS system cellobiose-specific IIA component|uniref:Phosphotransferase system cellobiose-specific component IIA n=1 Tax=Caldibacillus debilis GB1 TaxID=1339248 RepID=A0A420VB82_9BACI|nr:PTS lactose/cellobiose transporter subunit IIA [Caldibacillus debilis]RKO60778.1 Phosphotransferase system cellobiose-specific component IIA [Caldibacillus debilis GB1]
MNYEETMMQLILHGGNARGAAYEALDKAEEYQFDEAEKLLQEAHEEFLKAHKFQTQLIQSQEEGMVPSFFMIHAQDHVMTAQAELQLIKRLIRQIRQIEKFEKRLEELEKKVGQNE